MPAMTFTGWNPLSKKEMPKEWPIGLDVINEFFNVPADDLRLHSLINERGHEAARMGRKLLITYSPFYFASVWTASRM